MRSLPLLLTAATLALAGCAGGGPQDVVAETADNLGEITSGELDLRLVIEPRGGGTVGFELQGPFALAAGDDLPLARVRYTQIAGDERAEVTLISTRQGAFVEVEGQAYELPPGQADQLRGVSGGLGSEDDEGGLAGLEVEDWVEDGRLEERGEVDRVTGTVDVGAVAEDLLTLANDLGADVPDSLSERDRERLENALRSSRFELETGDDDRLLRRVHVDADFGLDVPEGLQGVLGRLVGAKVVFELGVRKPNEPVRVEPPEDALPYSALG